MASREFGYVADAMRQEPAPASLPKVSFSQDQVDYLRAIFPNTLEGILVMNGSEKVFGAVCIHMGENSVIEHIQSHIDTAQKATS